MTPPENQDRLYVLYICMTVVLCISTPPENQDGKSGDIVVVAPDAPVRRRVTRMAVSTEQGDSDGRTDRPGRLG